MKITITTAQEWQSAVESLSLKPGANLQALCLGILNHAFGENEDRCEIQIKRELILASSYLQAPGMVANAIKSKAVFPSVQSHLKGKYLVIVGAQEKQPTTFRARAHAALKSEGSFTCIKSSVPDSYRKRPELLGRSLAQVFGRTVLVKYKNDTIIWKLVGK